MILGLFEGFDLVAELGGAFVAFVFDGASEFFAEFGELSLAEFDGVFFSDFSRGRGRFCRCGGCRLVGRVQRRRRAG